MRSLYLIIPLAVALGASTVPLVAQAQIALDVSITTPPPELPVYDQPPLPAPGYIFTPGYWAYGYSGYYWVPGTWVEPPEPGLLWTPGYWGWNAGRYIFNAGYWGPTVGYYGGINYGFGYGGVGFEGGYWRGGSFFYNGRVNNFGGVHVTNVFERNVTNVTVNRYSFNGPNGVTRQASPAELAAARAPHVPPTAVQTQHVQAAQQNPSLRASVNHGSPAVLATPRPAASSGANPRPGMQAPSPHAVSRSVPVARPYSASPHPTTPGVGSVRGTTRPMSYAPARTATPAPMPHMAASGQGVPGMAPRPPAPAARPMAAPAPRPAAAPREEKPKR